MNLVLNGPDESPYEAGKDLNVVIACEDSALAADVCETLELLKGNLAKDGRLLYRWWNFEVLTCPTLRELAAMEAANADIILFGIHEGRALPAPVADWMQRWLKLRQRRPGAVVAVVAASLKTAAATAGNIVVQLKKTAAEGQMDFFATRAKEGRRGGGRNMGMTRGLAKLVGPPGNFSRRTEACAARIAGRKTGGAGRTGQPVKFQTSQPIER